LEQWYHRGNWTCMVLRIGTGDSEIGSGLRSTLCLGGGPPTDRQGGGACHRLALQDTPGVRTGERHLTRSWPAAIDCQRLLDSRAKEIWDSIFGTAKRFETRVGHSICDTIPFCTIDPHSQLQPNREQTGLQSKLQLGERPWTEYTENRCDARHAGVWPRLAFCEPRRDFSGIDTPASICRDKVRS